MRERAERERRERREERERGERGERGREERGRERREGGRERAEEKLPIHSFISVLSESAKPWVVIQQTSETLVSGK